MLYLGSIYFLKAQGRQQWQKQAQTMPDMSFGPKVHVFFSFFHAFIILINVFTFIYALKAWEGQQQQKRAQMMRLDASFGP